MLASIHWNDARGVIVLIRHKHILRRLKDLKWERHVIDARKAGQEAHIQRIGGGAVFKIPLALLQRLGLVRDLSIGRVDYDSASRRNAAGGSMSLQRGGRGVAGLPNALEIWLSVRRSRRLVAGGLPGKGRRQRQGKDDGKELHGKVTAWGCRERRRASR